MNGTDASYNDAVGWYLITSNGSVSIDVANTTFSHGYTGILIESSEDIDTSVVGSSFLGTNDLGMDLTADANITLNVEDSIFDGAIAENAEAFHPILAEEQYIIIQPDDGNWNSTAYGLTATFALRL